MSGRLSKRVAESGRRREATCEQIVAVILDDDNWFWAYDVSLAILAVEVLEVVKTGAGTDEPWLNDFRYHLTLPVLAQETYGLSIPADLTDTQQGHLLALFAVFLRRI